MKSSINRNSQPKWRKVKNIALSAFALGATLCTVSPALAQGYPPQTFYVSKNGNNTDGRSWATAWNEMDQIQWSQFNAQRHDSLVLDGGQRRMIYKKPLHVQLPANYYPTLISASTEAGHNGQVVIAPPANSKGIEISNAAVQLNGSRPSGILVYGAQDGLYVNSGGPYPFTVKNIELAHCREAGLFVSPSYYPVSLSQLIIHDNATNVIASQVGYGITSLAKCWIYNSSYHMDSDGIRIEGNSNGPPTNGLSLSNSVLGPGLRDGINNSLAQARPSLNNVLMINSTRNNVSSYTASLENVTSFMTRLNPTHHVHDCIKLQDPHLIYGTPSSIVKKTIVYGGMVEIPTTISLPYPPGQTVPFPIVVENNTQFRITGNTTVLAPSMVDPRFVTHVGILANSTPIPVLMRLDFSLRKNSPAQGTGSTITSIQGLLNTFTP